MVSESSTEAEVVGISDNTGDNLGIMYFLEGQAYDTKPMVLYQDNKSAITLINKGRSTSHRTRHIATRYFFNKDRVDQGDVKLVHRGTEEMVADYFTKPLQGEYFRKMRKHIMGTP